MGALWAPLFVGSLAAGLVLSVIAYFAMHLAWRMHVAHNWKKRQLIRQRRNETEK
ncbi:MAG: hypothetical protein CSH36_08620 [Thalassolituus sp.]|nr:MAG: hypothetical protein CSH36_08620 [Thalassolituus sp.]